MIGFGARIPIGGSQKLHPTSKALALSNDRRSLAVCLCGLAAALVVGARTERAAAQDDDAFAAQSSQQVLRAMSETLQAAKRISFHGEINFDDLLDDGQKVQFAGAMTVKLRRPDGLSVDYRDDLSTKQIWYDGKTFTLYDQVQDVYATVAAPPAIAQAVDQLERDYDLFMPLSELIIGDVYEKVLARARRGRYLGIHDVDGTACHHLAFVGENVDFQLWVEPGKTAVPRKLVVTFKLEPGSPQFVANLMDWDLDADLSDADFQKSLPEDAIATDFLKIENVRR